MAIQEQFQKALEDVQSLRDLGNEELLQLYGLFKQATVGDVSGSKPGMFDLKGKAKYEAWSRQKGLSKEKAMEAYVGYVKKLLSRKS